VPPQLQASQESGRNRPGPSRPGPSPEPLGLFGPGPLIPGLNAWNQVAHAVTKVSCHLCTVVGINTILKKQLKTKNNPWPILQSRREQGRMGTEDS
jgi:hypothetical protein